MLALSYLEYQILLFYILKKGDPKGFIFSNGRLADVEKYIQTGELPEYDLPAGILHIEQYKFSVKGFNNNQRNELVKLGGTYSARMKGGGGIIFDESARGTVESYIKNI